MAEFRTRGSRGKRGCQNPNQWRRTRRGKPTFPENLAMNADTSDPICNFRSGARLTYSGPTVSELHRLTGEPLNSLESAEFGCWRKSLNVSFMPSQRPPIRAYRKVCVFVLRFDLDPSRQKEVRAQHFWAKTTLTRPMLEAL